MTDRELIELILKKLDSMEDRMSSIESEIVSIKEDTAVTRSAVNSLVEWADTVGIITKVPFPIKKAE